MKFPAIVLLLVAITVPVCPVRAATAEDFGFGNLPLGTRSFIPLLVVTFEMSTNVVRPVDGVARLPLRNNSVNVFDQLFFNVLNFPSVAGYFNENSYGSFYWVRAGVIGPVVLSEAETRALDAFTCPPPPGSPPGTPPGRGLDCPDAFAWLVDKIATKTGYNFAQWDANHDGTVNQEELSIAVIGNNGEWYAANRSIGANGVVIPGQNVTVRGRIASIDHRSSFLNLTHELSHSLGTVDLYYDKTCWNTALSLMSCTIVEANDNRSTFHLDPWHKMRLGWLRPRIFTIQSGGIATLTASQFYPTNAPIILYDPARGFGEYFLVEFRNGSASAGSADHDKDTSTPAGLALWHVTENPVPIHHEGSTNLAAGGSRLWSTLTPLLTWKDGVSTSARLNPIGTSTDGREITFEWFTEVWVDFAYTGPEGGTFTKPFNTVAEGVAAVSQRGQIHLKSGATSEHLSITKAVKLNAVGGPATIGTP